MKKTTALLSGIWIGAGLMYFFDPDRGGGRRAVMCDNMAHSSNAARGAVDAAVRDARNRVQGALASIKSWFVSKPVEDGVLVERVRSKLGFLVRHPGSIRVTASRGRVTLSGPVLEDEAEHVVKGVSRVPGVTKVENRLDVYKEEDNVPGLQGGLRTPRRQVQRFEPMRNDWSPAARALAAGAGMILLLYGGRQRNAWGIGMAAVGLGLILRGMTNRELRQLLLEGFRSRRWRPAREVAQSFGEKGTKQLREVMTPHVGVIHPDASLREAAEKMKSLDVGVIPVCENDRLVGMLTDRDIVVRILAEKCDPDTTTVRDAMTPGVEYCFEDEDVREAVKRMEEKQVRRLVILNRNKRLVGIVSLEDLAARAKSMPLSGEVLEGVSEPSQPARSPA